MSLYRFTRDYHSSYGSWQKGEEAEFVDDFAAWLNRDVPGCVEPVVTAEFVAEARDVSAPPADRMTRKPAGRRSRGNAEE